MYHSQRTEGGKRGMFATQAIPKDTLVHSCAGPYASVVYRVFRKEVCARCFAYAFDVRRSTWNVRLPGVWFCSETCRAEWVLSENADGLAEAVNGAVDRLARRVDRHVAEETPPPPITQQIVDDAWAAASLPNDVPQLDPMELDTARFVLSALVRRHHTAADPPEGTWPALLDLQSNELPFLLAHPAALASQLRVFAFLRLVARAVPALAPYLHTPDAVRAIYAREHGNIFGLWEASAEGEEMFGWALYVSASYFNHDCAPNLRKQRLARSMHFFTTRDIHPGEELCTSYVDLTDPVHERRAQLARGWFFACVCARCVREAGEEE